MCHWDVLHDVHTARMHVLSTPPWHKDVSIFDATTDDSTHLTTDVKLLIDAANRCYSHVMAIP